MTTYLKIQVLQLFKWIKTLLGQLLLNNKKAQKSIKIKCSEDFFFWYEFFVCQSAQKKPPLNNYELLEPYQVNYISALIDSIDKGKDLLVEKSVGMGATQLTSLVFLWYWLYKNDSNLMILTKNSHGIKEIFNDYEKLLQTLPAGILDNRLIPEKKTGKKTENLYLKSIKKPRRTAILKNPSNGNVLYIFSAYKRLFPAHSKTFKAVFLDDFAFQRNQKEHWQSFKKVGCVKIVASCPNGTANYFYDLGQTGLKTYRLHWALKHQASIEWYKAQTEGKDPIYVEQYLNISYKVRQVKKRATKAACKAEGQAEASITARSRRPKRQTFRNWATKGEKANSLASRERAGAAYRRHRNPESFSAPSGYETARNSAIEGLQAISQQPAGQVNLKNKCLVSLNTAIEIVSEFSGIDIQKTIFRPVKEALYMKVSVDQQALKEIPYDAQVSQKKFSLL